MADDPVAGEVAELAREQRHVDRAYARLDVMRARARERSAQVVAQGRGGTHQARHDRDAFMHSSLYRLAQLDAAEYGLVFGRLDADDGDVWHIGRIGVNDHDYEPLVVDWRAPVAAPFYRATPLEPLGVRRRRHLQMRGRRVVRLDDELMDASAARSDDVVLVGEGALMAAVARPRSDRMADIVATIQREQDDVIRAPLDGVTVVQGGPGTGKTAVALHRVAYLLYANRERVEHLGVLVLGPSARFLRYIGDVLPGLGEQAVRLSRIDDLAGEDMVTADDPPDVRHVKGGARMATVLARLVRRWPWHTVTDEDWLDVADTMLDTLLDDEQVLRRVARDVLSQRDMALLTGHRRQGRSAADAALLDELDALVARRRPRRRQRAGDDDAARIEETLDAMGLDAMGLDGGMRAAARERLRRQAAIADERSQVYGHVVVDEAQELSAMQWRMLVRRCPSGSMTVVGDLDQAMRPDPLDAWQALSAHLPGRLRVFELTVNYRTPVEIMAYVEQQRELTGVRRHAPRSVRYSGHEPQLRTLDVPIGDGSGDSGGSDGLAGANDPGAIDVAAAAVEQALAERAGSPGTLAVIAPDVTVTDLRAALDADVPCLSARQAKGLEYDVVVVVAPERIAAADGGAALYVALTRATRELVVLAEPAPVACGS